MAIRQHCCDDIEFAERLLEKLQAFRLAQVAPLLLNPAKAPLDGNAVLAHRQVHLLLLVREVGALNARWIQADCGYAASPYAINA